MAASFSSKVYYTCVYASYFPDIHTFQIFIYILYLLRHAHSWHTHTHISQLFFSGQSHVLVRGRRRMWNFIIPARMRAREAQLWCHRILFISIYVCSPQRERAKEINKTKWGGHNTFGFSIFWRSCSRSHFPLSSFLSLLSFSLCFCCLSVALLYEF